MTLADRDYMRRAHPPYCTCIDCTQRRLEKQRKQEKFDPRFKPNGTIDRAFVSTKSAPIGRGHEGRKVQSNRSKIGKQIVLIVLSCSILLGIFLYTNQLGPWTPSPEVIPPLPIVDLPPQEEEKQTSTEEAVENIEEKDSPTVTVPLPIPEVPIILTYEVFTDKSAGFNTEYPKGWTIRVIPMEEEETRVYFTGQVNGTNEAVCSLLIEYNPNFTDSLGLWKSIANLAGGSLVDKKDPSIIGGIKGYELTQVIGGKTSRIFTSNWESGNLLATRSYPTDRLSLEEIGILNTYFDHLIASATITVLPTPITPTPKIDGFNSKTGEYRNLYLGLVYDEFVLGGTDCYGEFIVLINNKESTNPTYLQLLNFLKADKTDEFSYELTLLVVQYYYGEAEDKIDLEYIKSIIDRLAQPKDPKICADFAERLHNNAELEGIRCGYVSLEMDDSIGHACNMFETTDKGTVYIDVTGSLGNYGPLNSDTIVTIEIGREYNPEFLFPNEGWYIPSGSMGVVTSSFQTWDGDWR